MVPVVVVKTCVLNLSSDRPVGSGWKVQYFTDNTPLTNVSTQSARSVTVGPGTYRISARWTKSNVPPILSDTVEITIPVDSDTTIPDPPDPPDPPVVVDCVLSAWSEWSAWTPISAQYEQRERTRTIVTPPANGGLPCGPLREVETRPIAVEPEPPDPPAEGVIGPAQVAYLGALRVPSSGVDLVGMYGGMAGRVVSGQTRLFLNARWNFDPNGPVADVYELDVTGLTPNLDYTLAPRATLVQNWGDISHGRQLDYSPTGTPMPLYGGNGIPSGMYYHAATNMLLRGYHYVYTTDSKWSVIGATLDAPGVTTGYGPWRFEGPDKRTGFVWQGNRAHWFFENPRTGKMMAGGASKSGNTAIPWGPSAFESDFPTPSTPSGFSAPAIPQTEYLNYYFPSTDPWSWFVNNDGSWSGSIQSFQYRNCYPAALTYLQETFAPPYYNTKVNPALNGGIGSWSDELSGCVGAAWIEGTTRRGVLFFGRIIAAPGTDPNDNVNTAHEFYRNAGHIGVTLTGIVGTFVEGETITESVSGITAVVEGYHPSTATVGAVNNPPNDLTVGRTITGGTSGAHGVIATFWRNDQCRHGFTPIDVTGPITTASTPAIIIYDPAKLEAVAAGTAVDYQQVADAIIDLNALGVQTAPTTELAARSIAGGFYNPADGRLYLVAANADVAGGFNPLIHVFQITA